MVKHEIHEIIRREHPFSLIGMGEDKKPTKIKELTDTMATKIKSTLNSNYIKSDKREERLKWRREIWKGSIPIEKEWKHIWNFQVAE